MLRLFLVARIQRRELRMLLWTLAMLTCLTAHRGAAAASPLPAGELQKRVEAERQAIYDLQQKLIPLLRKGEGDGAARAQATALENEIAAHGERMAKAAELLSAAQTGDAHAEVNQQLAAIQAQLADRNHQVEDLSRQFELARQQFAEAQRAQEQIPLEGAEIKVFTLRRAKASEAGDTIAALLGSGRVRVALDERTNALIVAGNAEALSMIEALLMRLDEQAAHTVEEGEGAHAQMNATDSRAMFVRIFWLSDKLPAGVGQDPAKYLPASVLKALDEVGLDAPRIVTQVVNSAIVVDSDGQGPRFRTATTVQSGGVATNMICTGTPRLTADDRIVLQLSVQLEGPNPCQVDGFLTMPMGHYAVLGTANTTAPDPANGNVDPNTGLPLGGIGGGGLDPAALATAAGAMPFGGMGPQNVVPSRLAFVVQVIENKSYPDDK